MNQYLRTPSGAFITEGTTIVPDPSEATSNWIVHNGWYTYLGEICKGWYMVRIADGHVEPLTSNTLSTLVVVSEYTVFPIHDNDEQNEGETI